MESKEDKQLANANEQPDEVDNTTKKQNLGYPKQIVYCPKCHLPPEYCEYGPHFSQCIPWLKENYPQFIPSETDEKKPAGGATEEAKTEGAPKTEEKESKRVKIKEEPKIVIEKTNRNKKKFLTTVSGLDKLGFVVKDLAKKFGKKFACGSSVIDNGAIEIQGDVLYELQEYILKEFKDIKESQITLKEKNEKPAPK